MRVRLAAAFFVGMACAAASAFPSYGTYVDTTCTARGWIPARPYNPNRVNSTSPTQVNCGLCHTNALNPGSSLTTAGRTFKASGRTDVSPFCAPPPPMNHAPTIAPIAAQQVMVGQALQLAVLASDADGHAIVLSVSNAPSGSTFSDAGGGTGSFRWTPSAAQLGNHSVTFHAADNGSPMASAALSVTITVGAQVNRPPVLAAIGDQQVDPGMTLALTLSATDPEGDSLAFSMQPLPTGASLTGASFAWSPSAQDVGSYPVTITVTDSGSPAASDSEAIVITVGRVNRPPLLGPIGNRTVDLGQTLQVALTASDPDGDALTLACSGLPSGASFTALGAGTGQIDWAPSVATSASVTCSASDGGIPVGVAQETFLLTARDPAPPAGAPALERARWNREKRRLEFAGEIPEESAAGASLRVDLFAVMPDGARVSLGGRRVGDDGDFHGALRTFLAPCQVAASVNGLASAPLAVEDADAACDAALLLQMRARSRCDGFELKVKGRRAPPAGLVIGSDAGSGGELFRLTANARGAFKARIPTDAFVHELAVRVEAGGAAWDLAAPIDVRRGCGR